MDLLAVTYIIIALASSSSNSTISSWSCHYFLCLKKWRG